MNPIDLITEEQFNMMTDYISEYAAKKSINERNRKDIRKILSIWNESKQDLFKIFGNQLFISKDIEFKKDKKELEEEFSKKIASESEFFKEYSNWIYKERLDRMFTYNYNYFDLISVESLLNNEYKGENFNILLPNNKTLKVSKGCKPMRILNKIAKAFDLKHFEEFRLLHSQILNQKSLKGKLTLSIHPMDFMTLSDNNCGWDTCLSWINPGSYRSGTVEMMNSPIVVVAYLESETPMKILNKYNWNNKKWRQLFIVDPTNIIISIKSYPYENKYLTVEALNLLKELVEKNTDNKYSDNYETFYGDATFFGKNENVNITFIFDSFKMYNDFGTVKSYCYPNLNIFKEQENLIIHIFYSGLSQCLICGETSFYDNDDSEIENFAQCLICPKCEPLYTCEECGDLIAEEDVYELNGNIFCAKCYDLYVVHCSLSNKKYLFTNNIKLYLARDKDHITRDYFLNTCKESLNLEFKKYFKRLRYREKEGYYTYPIVYFTWDDLTEYGKQYITDLYTTKPIMIDFHNTKFLKEEQILESDDILKFDF